MTRLDTFGRWAIFVSAILGAVAGVLVGIFG